MGEGVIVDEGTVLDVDEMGRIKAADAGAEDAGEQG